MNQLIMRFALTVGVAGLTASWAVASPLAWYSFNGGPETFVTNWVQDPEGDWIANFHEQTASYELSGNVEIMDDPAIIYGLSVTNYSPATSMFSFDFKDTWTTPIVGQAVTYGAIGGHVTDATGNGVSVTRVNPYLQMTDLNGIDSKTDAYNQDFSRGSGFPGVVYDLGTDSQGPRFGPIGNYTSLHAGTAFRLSNDDDVVVLTGSANVFQNPVPEPTSVVLLGAGLLGLAVWNRRRPA